MEIEVKIVDDLIEQLFNIKFYSGKGDLLATSIKQKNFMYKLIAKRIYDISQYLVPVDTGALKKSGKIMYDTNGTMKVVYTRTYANYVHEIIDNWHEHPTQAKFLEDAGYIALGEFDSSTPFFTFDIEIADEYVALHIDSINVDQFILNAKDRWMMQNIEVDLWDYLDGTTKPTIEPEDYSKNWAKQLGLTGGDLNE